ncbi:MAG: hypothetical protein PHR06_04735 [Candidatus Cloacimonetes bacterium]|nr:hypothetical protein [Candidatus Cloacimonadota bacterium]
MNNRFNINLELLSPENTETREDAGANCRNSKQQEIFIKCSVTSDKSASLVPET